jgi:replication-associated recombination protein RarA
MALMLGMPEARIPLGDAAVLMATSPKSNSAHVALDAALADVRKGKGLKPEYEEAMIQQLFDSYSYLATGWDEESDDPDFEEEFKADCTVYLVEITEEQYNEEMGAE